ncbi:lipopolysaccharide heptosyltransferase II [Desulfobacula toluolica]|uniref:lipopolysaccharide heptosyltransferase II n=1 Tax=Desulfobacula toluolica (strain DSM 7467 / Tol2) TaxID=651182 RepID=K0NL07_DESTT|nr:lipopolysaccharide heptosyltransferase II [Desulfobacula toluolica]CCK79412.1 predicted lipopolysaccharide heptosyltransferase II [Desulfobacula toluolica Tol2]
MKILIIKLSAIGDVIHTLPALNSLRNFYPHAHITWIVEEAALPLIRGHNSIDRIILSKRKKWIKKLLNPLARKKTLKEIYNFIKDIRDTRYDIIIDFHQLLKSGILVLLAKGVRKIGFDKGMPHMEESQIFLNEKIPPVSVEIHALKRNLMLLEAIGIPTKNIEYQISTDQNDEDNVMKLIHENKIKDGFVVLNPVAKWDSKLWQNHKWAQLADILIKNYNTCVIFSGSVDDYFLIEEIRGMMQEKAVNFAGKTSLKSLAILYSKAKIIITTDTGPMHLAAAIKTPVIALFGPTAPWRTGPFGLTHKIIRKSMSCSPCFKRICPYGHHNCMKSINVDDIQILLSKSTHQICSS